MMRIQLTLEAEVAPSEFENPSLYLIELVDNLWYQNKTSGKVMDDYGKAIGHFNVRILEQAE